MNHTHSNSQDSHMNGMMGSSVRWENEALRLQREADNFTKKFEHEKK